VIYPHPLSDHGQAAQLVAARLDIPWSQAVAVARCLDLAPIPGQAAIVTALEIARALNDAELLAVLTHTTIPGTPQ
jgi:hypothetical protein